MFLSWVNSWNNYELLVNIVNSKQLCGRCLEMVTCIEHRIRCAQWWEDYTGQYLLCCTHHSRTSRWAHSPSQASLRSLSPPWSCTDIEERDGISGVRGCNELQDLAFCLSRKSHTLTSEQPRLQSQLPGSCGVSAATSWLMRGSGSVSSPGAQAVDGEAWILYPGGSQGLGSLPLSTALVPSPGSQRRLL